MIAVLAPRHDPTADRVAHACTAVTGHPPVWLDPAQLAETSVWHHELSSRGHATTRLRVALGPNRHVEVSEPVTFFNRLVPPPLHRFRAADRSYALMENIALWLSWLAADGHRVVNPYDAAGATGIRRGVIGWAQLARDCGLAVRERRLTTNARMATTKGWRPGGQRTPIPLGEVPADLLRSQPVERREVLVAGSTVLGAPSPSIASGLLQVAVYADLPLFATSLVRGDDGNWSIDRVDDRPRLVSDDWVVATARLLARQEVRT